MKVLTEADLRAGYRKADMQEIHVQEGTFVTPTALEYIKEKGLNLIFDGSNQMERQSVPLSIHKKSQDREAVYVSAYDGVVYSEKPEHMTHLRGNILVPKNHLRIVCRGKLDSLQAKILEVQVIARRNAEFLITEDLQQLLDLARRILSCEVKDEPLSSIMLLGLNEVQLRDMSHHPHKHFGIEHILPSCTMGEVVVALNSVRTAVRESEIAAINAFSTEGSLEREDLIKALNRLSSAVYLLICRKLSGWYEKDR